MKVELVVLLLNANCVSLDVLHRLAMEVLHVVTAKQVELATVARNVSMEGIEETLIHWQSALIVR